MQTRPIPSSGKALPVIGCGTYVGFDVGADTEKLKTLADVVRTLRNAGGKVFDSSPMYGRAEAVLGDLLAAAPDPERTFIATKVWTRGRQAGITQMERSFALLRSKRIDLMQVHNLLDWQTHLRTLRGWKQDGRIRYLGVSGFVASMARPGGNLTSFSVFEPAIGGKWLEIFKEIAPNVSRVGFILHPETSANVGLLRAAEAGAPSGVKLIALGVHNTAEIERAVTAFAADVEAGTFPDEEHSYH